jgi:hypothetical protein
MARRRFRVHLDQPAVDPLAQEPRRQLARALLAPLALLEVARRRHLGQVRHLGGQVGAVVDQHPPLVLEGDLDLVVGQQLGDEAGPELGVRHDVHLLVRVADRVGPAAGQLLLGDLGHRLFPARFSAQLAPGHHLFGSRFSGIAARLAEGMDVAAHLALHATDLVLVHADDGVICVRLAAWTRAISLDFTPNFVLVIIEEGIHGGRLSPVVFQAYEISGK